jgi:hypothetical protein
MVYPGLAPELALRSGMGGWDPYTLDAPTDRLLPFVLTRAWSGRNAPWVSCAWIEHADTAQRLATLLPTGAQALPATVPALGIVFSKLVDQASRIEHFTYEGTLIPGLSSALPCGVPLRLVVDNAYQSPRFFAFGLARDLAKSHLLLEWHHDGPLSGVPYGRGFRQCFYIPNGATAELDPRRVEESTANADTGINRQDSLSLFAQQSFSVSPVPAYLSQALSAAPACKYLLADGRPCKLLSTKVSPSGENGRWSLLGTLEDETPTLSRGCKADPLPVEAYNAAASVPRGYRCGDTSDKASDFRPNGTYSCELSSGQNTGYVLQEIEDLNPYSGTYKQKSTQLSASQDLARCPLRYFSAQHQASTRKSDCQSGYVGSIVTLTLQPRAYSSTVSQADADAQAEAYVLNQLQAYANANGTCSLPDSSSSGYRATYSANGCFTGFMENENDPSDVRDATQAEYTRYRLLNYGSDNQECPSYT